MHAAHGQRQPAELVQQEAEIAAWLIQLLFRVDKQAGDEDHQQKQQHQRQKTPDEEHRYLPDGAVRSKLTADIRQRNAGDETDRKKNIEHFELTPAEEKVCAGKAARAVCSRLSL